MKLTKAAVQALRLPPGQTDLIVLDDALKGFGVRLRGGGKRTWIIQYRVGKKQRRKTLGSLNKISIERARAAAERDLAEVTLGADPQAKKNQERARASETLEAVSAAFLERRRREVASGELRPRSLEQIADHLTNHWAPLKRLSIHDIEQRQIAIRLGEIAAERGPFSANRARATLSALYRWAMGEGIVKANPVISTNRQVNESDHARDRVLSNDELLAVWKACRDDDYGRIVRLLILTGQRRDEVGAIAKSEIALGARKWTIPGERAKNGEASDIPLSDSAAEIIEAAIRDCMEGRDCIFGEGNSGRGFSGWSRAKGALDQRVAEMTGAEPLAWRVHDLRRTAATRMADLGALPHVVESVLNHISGHKGGVAGIYNRATYWAEKRQALDVWAAHIEALIAGETSSNVVPFKA